MNPVKLNRLKSLIGFFKNYLAKRTGQIFIGQNREESQKEVEMIFLHLRLGS
jgi:hypothetical protein